MKKQMSIVTKARHMLTKRHCVDLVTLHLIVKYSRLPGQGAQEAVVSQSLVFIYHFILPSSIIII